jgi:gliding motility-associated-like protein
MKLILFTKITLIFLLLSSIHVYAQGGDNAAAAAASPITLPFFAAGTTCGHVDNYNPLGSYAITPDGKDWLYYFCAPTSGVIDIFMSNAYGTPPAIMVYNAVPNATGSNWTQTSFTGANNMNSVVSVTATAGSCYYVMIDNYPTATFPQTCIDYSLTIQYHVNPPVATLQPACTNIGYDFGNLSGWIGTAGAVTQGIVSDPTPVYTPLYYTTSATQHSVTSGAGVDPYGGFPIVNPAGGTNSIRLGDMGNFGATNQFFGGIPGNGGATIEQKFSVTASNALFVYYYAVVIQDAGSDHTNPEQPFFKTDIYDCTGVPVACGQYLVTGGPGIPGFTLAGTGSNVYWKNWSPVAVDLTPYIGTCVTVRYTVGDCTRGAHFAYAYIDANCSPLAITGINQVCPTKSTTLTAPVGLFTYSWTPGGASTQSIVVTPTATTNYTCELTSYTNCKTFLTYSVSLFPAAIASSNSQTVCSGTSALLTSTVNNGPGTYTWGPTGGTGSSASPSPTATTIYTVTYTDGNGCKDTALSRVTVNPLPSMNTPANIIVCNNGSVPASAFSSTVAGTTYSWTNTNSAIGLAVNGSGNTPVFTAINAGASAVNAVVSVTPTANSCVGPPITYTITVNPIPNVNAVPSATYCAGAIVPATNFAGSVTATTYSWTNSNSAIGLTTSGIGNIASYGAANSTATGISGVITVTPSANTCIGIPSNFTVTVNPIPTVSVVPNTTYCSGATVPATTFTGNVTTAIYNWSNSNSAIGLTTSGIGNIASYGAANSTATGISGVITVTPSANSCVGTPANFTVTVNPIPNVTAIPSATYCAGTIAPTTNFTGSVTATTYDWTNSNSAIGLASSGAGNITSYTTTNASSAGISGVVTVTPSANSCIGTPINFTVTVNPIPTVSAITSSTFCSGAIVPATTFSGNISGTAYNWTNSNSSIGSGASGVGSISSFTSANTGATSINGVVTVTPSLNSCIGTPTNFTITVNPNPIAPTVANPTVCPSSSASLTATAPGGTYNWYDNIVGGTLLTTNSTYITPGLIVTTTYYVNTTNASGCVSPFTAVVANVLNSLTVNASPNQTICIGSSATLSVSPTAAGNAYSWDTSGNLAFSNLANPVVSPVITTTYSVSVTNIQGCTGTSQTQVVVNALPIAYAGNPIAFCNGSSGTIGSAAISGYSYSWIPTTGLSNASTPSPTVTLPNSGSTPSVSNYTLTVTQNGCQASNQVQVTVNPTPQSIAGSPLTLCSGQSGSIGTFDNSNYSYAWSPATNLSSASVPDPTVSVMNVGTSTVSISYTVTTTETSTSCYSTDAVIVTIFPLPTVNAGGGVSACEGVTALSLNGTIGGSANSAIWSGGSGSFTTNNMVLNSVYHPSAGDYINSPLTLTLTAIANAPCQNVMSTVQIVFYKKPLINFVVDFPAGCPEHCVTFTDQSSVDAPDFIQSWNWNFGDGGTSSVQNPGHCYTQAGLYSVTLTAMSNHLCSNTLTIPGMVEVYPNPVASFYATPPVADVTDPNITFQNTSQGAISYNWGFGDSYSSGSNNESTVTNPIHEYTHSGEYVVTLVATSIHGCEDRTSNTIEIKPEFTFYIPNCFTPDGSDGVNDIFYGMGVGIEKYEMWVFDRWGEKIFYTNDIHKGWDGKKAGHDKIVQQDVYVWKVKLTDVFAKKHDYIGHVTLLK